MDLGMSELLVIGIVALIVIGPKDLPEMFRQLGRFTAKMRAMAREFSRAMEQAANESGVSDIAKDLKAATNPKAMGMNAVKDAVDKFEKWDPIKNAAKPSQPQASSTLVTPATPQPAVPVATSVATPIGAEPVAAAPVGPNTAALYEKKASRQAIVQESNAKLKALDEPLPAADAKPKRVAKPAAVATADPVPKAPRKKKAAEE